MTSESRESSDFLEWRDSLVNTREWYYSYDDLVAEPSFSEVSCWAWQSDGDVHSY